MISPKMSVILNLGLPSSWTAYQPPLQLSSLFNLQVRQWCHWINQLNLQDLIRDQPKYNHTVRYTSLGDQHQPDLHQVSDDIIPVLPPSPPPQL